MSSFQYPLCHVILTLAIINETDYYFKFLNTETKWGNQAPGIPTLVQSLPTWNCTDTYNQKDNAKMMSITSKDMS